MSVKDHTIKTISRKFQQLGLRFVTCKGDMLTASANRAYDPTADEDAGTGITLWFDLDEHYEGAGREVQVLDVRSEVLGLGHRAIEAVMECLTKDVRVVALTAQDAESPVRWSALTEQHPNLTPC